MARIPFPATNFFFAVFLSLSCLSRVTTQKKSSDINKYFTMYDNGNWIEKKEAIRHIKRFPSAQTFSFLIKAADDPYSIIRIEALKSISLHVPPEAVGKVKQLALTEKNSNVRWQAIRTLSRYKDPASALVFAKSLKSDDWLIREEAIKGLLQINDYAIRYVSIPYILEALDDPVESIVITTLNELSIKDQRLYQKITNLLQETPAHNHSLLQAVLIALKGYKYDSATRETIVKLLVHRNRDIRIAAFRALKSESELIERLAEEKNR
jgi:hypothetical protein